MSVDSAEKNSVETSVVDGSVTSLVSIDAVGTFELEHDLLFETESISVSGAAFVLSDDTVHYNICLMKVAILNNDTIVQARNQGGLERADDPPSVGKRSAFAGERKYSSIQ